MRRVGTASFEQPMRQFETVKFYSVRCIRNLLMPSSVWLMVSAEKSVESVLGAAEHQPDAYLIKPRRSAFSTAWCLLTQSSLCIALLM